MIMKRINTTAKPAQINEVVAFAHNGNTEIVETLDFRDGVRYTLEFVKETSAERDRLKEDLQMICNYVSMREFDINVLRSMVEQSKIDHKL